MDGNVYPEVESDLGKAIAIWLRAEGFPEPRIARLWDCNDDRVAEVIGTLRGKENDQVQDAAQYFSPTEVTMTDIPKITVIVRGGLVQDVEIKGKACVVVHDYDVDMDPGDRPHGRNEDGELYVIAGEYCSDT